MSIVVRTDVDPLGIVGLLRHELRGPAGDQVLYATRTLEQLARATLARHRFLLVLFSAFAGFALLLAGVGVYGLLSYLTSQRIPEFGVRMALGATRRDIMQLVVRQSVPMVVAGAALGTGGAWAAARVLQRVVEGMQPVEASTIAATTAILVVSALSASLVPACRAGRVDAMTALRHD